MVAFTGNPRGHILLVWVIPIHTHLDSSRGGVVFMMMNEAILKFCEWRQLKVTHSCLRTYKSALVGLCMDLQNPDIEEITLDQVMEHFRKLQDFGYEDNGLLVRSIALRKFLEFYMLQGYPVLHNELIPIPKRGYKLPRVADEGRFEKMMAAIPNSDEIRHIRDRAMLSLLWDSGARAGEILSMQVDKIDLKRMCYTIKTEKARNARPFRCIFWTKRTNDYLKAWLKKREQVIRPGFDVELKDGNPVFISFRRFGRVRVVKALKVGSLSYITRNYCRMAGVEPLNPHSFRHYMGHKIIKSGGSSADVSNILGHSTLNSSFIYTMMAGDELEERYRVFRGS